MENKVISSAVADAPLPDWLVVPDPAPAKLSKDAKKLHVARFEAVFPRVMNMIAEGCDMTSAISQLPVDVDVGAFRRWLKKDPARSEELKEAEELRSEVWADKLLKHAIGEYGLEDVNRSRLIVDTYKWRITADYRRKFGDQKTVEFAGSVSILDALEQANRRAFTVIDVSSQSSGLSIEDKS